MMFFTATVIILALTAETKETPTTRIMNNEILEAQNFRSNSSFHRSTLSESCYNFCDDSFPCSDAFTDSQLIAAFSIENTAACKMYCWYHKSCWSFTVNIQTSACGLYSNFPFLHNNKDSSTSKGAKSPIFDFIGDIKCLQNLERSPSVPCRTIKNLVKESQGSEGVLIKNVASHRCLGFGKVKDLKWKDCTLAALWQLEENGNGTSNGKGIKIKSISADSRTHCLTVGTTVMSRNLLSVVACQEGNSNQVFQLTIGTQNNLSSMPDPEGNDNICFFQITKDKMTVCTKSFSKEVPLSVMRILQPSEHLALCQRNQLDLPNGKIEGKMPFYLPGSNISVRCVPGYGFKYFSFQSALNVTCRNERTKAPKCVKVETKLRGKFPLMTVLAGGNGVQAILIIYLGAWVFVLARKMRSLKADQLSAGIGESEPDLNTES